MMKIVSWNVNGLRSLEKPVKAVLDELDADIVCLQETKTTRDQLQESYAVVDGYSAYFSFSRVRSGYSGVVTYCKDGTAPYSAREGLSGPMAEFTLAHSVGVGKCDVGDSLPELDREGRCVLTEHWIDSERTKSLHIFNVYCPFVDFQSGAEDRKKFRLSFLNVLGRRAEYLTLKGPVVICGDLNISHMPIDHCAPGDLKEFHSSLSRQWLRTLLDAGKPAYFVDSFRFLNPEAKEAFSCWNTKTGARLTNYGTRIDYILVDHTTQPLLNEAAILQHYMGSDHCPISMQCSLSIVPSFSLPDMCAKLFPEFRGTQRKLTDFAVKDSKRQFQSAFTTDRSTHLLPKKKVGSQKSLHSYFSKPKSSVVDVSGVIIIDDDETTNNTTAAIDCEVLSKSDTADDTAFNGGVFNITAADAANDLVDKGAGKTVACPLANCKSKGSLPNLSKSWKSVFKTKEMPLCRGHKEPCVMRTVKKDSLNCGRQFYACARPMGSKSCAEAKCDHFEWVAKSTKSNPGSGAA